MKVVYFSIFFFILADESLAVDEVTKTIPAASSAGSILNVIFGLAVVLAVIYVLAFGIKKMGAIPGKSNSILRVVSGLNLSQRDKLVLVQVGKEQLLLGVSPGRINLLHNLAEPVDADMVSTDLQESGFAKKLTDVMRMDKD